MSNEAKLLEENLRLKAKINALGSTLTVVNQKLSATETEKATLQEKYDGLLETIKLANQRKFSPSSEANILQQNLFDEIGVASYEPNEQKPDDKTGTTTYIVTRKKKNHPTRTPLPEHLPRVKTVLEPIEADKICSCGCQREQMGQEVTEELIVEPAKILVNQIIRPKMVCKNKDCDNDKIIIVPLVRLLPKTNASPSLIADIVTKKYVDHLPLYRQEKIWERLDIILPRNLLCGWLMMTADKCEPLYKLLNQYLLGYDIVHADETTAQVLKEMGRTSKQKSYIWSYKGGPPDKSVVIFDYQETRENKHPIKFLTGFTGYIMTDAYTGYDWIGRKEFEACIRVFCMAHARRPFAELAKLSNTKTASHEVLGYFAKLYSIEKQARENKLSDSKRFLLRVKEAKPVLDALFSFLKTITTPRKMKLGQAIHYMLAREHEFYTYLYDGRLEIDNNVLENQIRPFAIGRKNWMFLGSPKGARAACIFYSLIQTAKLHNIEPRAYLAAVFRKLAACKTDADYQALLPWNLKAEIKIDENKFSANNMLLKTT